jgi:hypothetical protein
MDDVFNFWGTCDVGIQVSFNIVIQTPTQFKAIL